ncbi:cytolethal distending toxin subunit A [Ursidibacter arcticus]
MYKKCFYFLVSLCLFGVSYAEQKSPDPTSYPDVTLPAPPVISIRSLYTGEPLRNDHYGERSEKNVHWSLVDIKVGNKPFVQFKALDTEKCFTGGNVVECTDTARTAFTLVPTDTGAFVLQSSFDGSCFASFGFRDYRFEQCLRPSQITNGVDLPYLWAIVPPFGQNKILVPPVK